MTAAEHFCQPDLVIITLSHLSAIDGDHVIMNPIANRRLVIADSALRYLAFMMREQQVHATAMYVKLRSQILCGHSRAFDMPTRKTNAPGALPTHNMLRRCIFP